MSNLFQHINLVAYDIINLLEGKMKKINIVGLVGSIRKDSYNKKVMLTIKDKLPTNVDLNIADISNLPLFNEDLEDDVPLAVLDFINSISNADAVIICTAEYNYSIPGVLKNALDWASRANNSPLSNKPVAITSASLGMLGGARVQYHLRQVCVALNMRPLNYPEIFITNVHEKFNDNLLADEYTKKAIKKMIEQLLINIEK